MDHGDLVVVLEPPGIRGQGPGAIGLEDPAHALHAEVVQLGGAQRAHAGAAEHVDALCHGPQDLLVPDRQHAVEVAVDDADRTRALLCRAIEVALAHRRQHHEIGGLRQLFGAQGGADEHHGCHGVRSAAAKARGPGR